MTDRVRPDLMDREDILMVASLLVTERHDPHVVLFTASHLLAWLTGDGDQDGVRLRSAAMIRQYHNSGKRDGTITHADDPDGFVEAAAEYIPFLSGVT